MNFTCELNEDNFFNMNDLRASFLSNLINFKATSSNEFLVWAYNTALSSYL